MTDITTIQTTEAPAAIGPYSQAIRVDGWLFASGQIPIDPATGDLLDGSVAEQTAQVIRNLEAVLAAAGATLEDVVKTTVFLSDMGRFAEMNEVYAEYFGDHRPARSTVQAAALPKYVDVEIDVIARLSE